MEKPGEQFTVVFALTVTEPVCECVWRGGGVDTLHPTLPPIIRFRNKDDSELFSRFLHAYSW